MIGIPLALANFKLIPRGRAQAASLARELAALPLAAVYASPLRRARETAAAMAAAAGRPVVVDARLAERMNWQGEEPLQAFLDEWRRASADRAYAPGHGESSYAAGRRFAALLAQLAPGHRGQAIALVGHGGATADLLRTLYGDERVRRMAPGVIERGVPSCAVTHLRGGEEALVAVAVASPAGEVERGRPWGPPTR